MEKAKIAMDTYHTTRTHCPEFFAKRDVNGADVAAQMKVLYVTPQTLKALNSKSINHVHYS